MTTSRLRWITFAALCSMAPYFVVALADDYVELRARLGEDHVGAEAGNLGGWLITHAPEWTWQYAVSRSRTAGHDVLWLKRYLRTTEKGEAVWRTVDFLVLPALGPNQHLATGGSCSVNDSHDPTIIAIIEAAGGVSTAVVISAWRVDETAERFETTMLHGIHCDPIGWGGAKG